MRYAGAMACRSSAAPKIKALTVGYKLKIYITAILGNWSLDNDLCSKNVMNNLYVYDVYTQVSRSSAINLAYLPSSAY